MPRGQTPAASAQQQRDTSSTSDKGDISLKEEEIWNTNDQLFPEWYPTLIRALREGPIKFQLYFERLTTMEKHLVCCTTTTTSKPCKRTSSATTARSSYHSSRRTFQMSPYFRRLLTHQLVTEDRPVPAHTPSGADRLTISFVGGSIPNRGNSVTGYRGIVYVLCARYVFSCGVVARAPRLLRARGVVQASTRPTDPLGSLAVGAVE